jgi:hypothetical protein
MNPDLSRRAARLKTTDAFHVLTREQRREMPYLVEKADCFEDLPEHLQRWILDAEKEKGPYVPAPSRVSVEAAR